MTRPKWCIVQPKGAATRYENKHIDISLKETSDKWVEEARRELLSDERVLSTRYKETAVVYDANGKFVFQKRGSYNEVSFTLLEMKKFKGCVISHNHPSGGSLSVSDIYALKKAIQQKSVCRHQMEYIIYIDLQNGRQK